MTQEKKYETREQWLRACVDLVNEKVYGGDMDIVKYQISSALLGGKQLGNTIMPFDGEDVGLDDFFPPTIHIDEKIQDPVTIVATVAHEMIHAFKDIHKHGKQFGAVAGPAGFEKPYVTLHLGEDLSMKCHEIADELGVFPGQAVKPHKKEKKPKTFSGVIFCPECGYELRVKEKAFKQHGLPVCPCGCKMALDCTENEETSNEQEAGE